MGNKKQDGSNITSVEYYTGRCPTMCEQCFVNFGQQGCTTIKNITHPKSTAWFEYAVQESQRPALRGRRPVTWKVPRPDPKGERLGEINEDSAEAIPMNYNPIIRRKKNKQVVKIDGKTYPLFLRVSSMSDSSYSPDYWLREIYDNWGDNCFFNSAIRSIARQPGNMALYHKLVVTMNPGKQKASPITKTIGVHDGVPNEHVRGSIQKTGKDYLNPHSLGMIGMGQYEDIVKFYRLRALPTVAPAIPDDVRAPVVVTQMRFKSLAYACEFARYYGLNIEAELWTAASVKTANFFGIKYHKHNPKRKQSPPLRVLIWSKKGDGRNYSQYKNYASEYVYANGFLRPVNVQAYDEYPYVCDRSHGMCANCGLCASLDGTQVNDTNPLNPLPPVPGGSSYIAKSKKATDYLAILLEREGLPMLDADDIAALSAYYERRKNPDHVPSMEAIEGLIYNAADYLLQGYSGDSFCEGWDTHEQANTMVAYCVWGLMKYAHQAGMSDEEAYDYIFGTIYEMAEGVDVVGGVDELWEMWTDESVWTAQFGSSY